LPRRPLPSIRVVDKDGDGALTATEHETASRGMFDRMDADKDDFLSPAEWDAGHAALKRSAK